MPAKQQDATKGKPGGGKGKKKKSMQKGNVGMTKGEMPGKMKGESSEKGAKPKDSKAEVFGKKPAKKAPKKKK